MKRWTAWKSGVPTTGSTCYGSTGAGRIAIGGIGGKSSQRTYALRPIYLQYVRGLLSHNDNDPLQQRSFCVPVAVRHTIWTLGRAWRVALECLPVLLT